MLSASFTVSVQVGSLPLQAPLQPVKALPDAGLAVSVINVPALTPAAHLLPQLNSLSAEATLPLPLLVIVTDGTLTLAAAICAPTNSPTSPACGVVHVRSAHNAS